MNLYFQDESRFGMFTRNGKILTSKGKTYLSLPSSFKSTYLLAHFPLDGDNFLMEMSLCNAQTFQVYLNELSKHRPSEYKILVLDNAAFHKAKKLNIPENIGMIFLPPYSELNPAEKGGNLNDHLQIFYAVL
ncbi:MAG: transposase [Sphingobacteriales bacterium]|nr:transposase [Sphingobacteriales bacterium]